MTFYFLISLAHKCIHHLYIAELFLIYLQGKYPSHLHSSFNASPKYNILGLAKAILYFIIKSYVIAFAIHI